MNRLKMPTIAIVAITLISSQASADLSDWTVVNNAGGPQWSSIAGAGESGNYTGGVDEAATVSSDIFGPGEFDTEFISPVIDLSGVTSATLTYLANYHNFGNLDFLDTDVSTNGGGTWTNLQSWNEDHGAFRSTPGELVTLALPGGSANTLIRYHYYDPNIGDFGFYAQIDNVEVTNDSGGAIVFADDFDAIPEPSTMSLLGMLGLAAVSRRRRR